MKEIGIGLLGFGTVGSGVVAALQTAGERLAERLGMRLVLRRIADVDWERDRGISVPATLLTRDGNAVISDPAVSIVIELIGGTGAARDFVRRALEAGKPVVTANKALLAEHGEELFALARRHKTELRFEASVGGTIPVVKALREGLVANRLVAIRGILNGTCNYMLTRMEEGLSFDAALKATQRQGYAEADPRLDVEGHDALHKAILLASLAVDAVVPIHRGYREGIRGLTPQDLRNARAHRYRVKLLAFVVIRNEELDVRVHPTLVWETHRLATVDDVFNGIEVVGDLSGTTFYYGPGAGRFPTASAVLADVADVAGALAAGHASRRLSFPRGGYAGAWRNPETLTHPYYVRVPLVRPHTRMISVLGCLRAQGIRVASCSRETHGSANRPALVIFTECCTERAMQRAIAALNACPQVRAPVTRIRIWDPAREEPEQ